ncbi:TPA: hypothetical protein DIS56_00870 [Candidatus Saccharibacteria bacterium]|nr:MAG: hypothetical protein UX30_C0003G0106 [Candidatus Saccharibacteria bacterium GW2011_GWA2_46_10]OGL36291.1 MAG: hypothetical protein A3F05_03190 [Candidatus Saccharibacteria bacterium RIFCSPHIGHO2_12_FULL_47_17]HCM51675.1 hypothetical protein [Candidatus Saccharibacteria bacterium]
MSERPDAIRTPKDVAQLFMVADAWNPQYKEYGQCASRAEWALDHIAIAVFTKTETSIPLPLHPVRDEQDDPFKLYVDDPVSRELRDMIYSVTQANIVTDTRSENNPYGKVVQHGWHQGQQINFIESYVKSKNGDYMRWDVVTDVPEEVFASIYEPKPFKTSDKRLEEGLFRALETAYALPTAEVDETTVIAGWVKKQAA